MRNNKLKENNNSLNQIYKISDLKINQLIYKLR